MPQISESMIRRLELMVTTAQSQFQTEYSAPSTRATGSYHVGNLWEYLGDRECHSGLMPANLITLAHFSVSSPMTLPKSAGEPASTVPPPSTRCFISLGSERLAFISLLSLSTTSAGVFRGAPTPQKALAS